MEDTLHLHVLASVFALLSTSQMMKTKSLIKLTEAYFDKLDKSLQ